MACFEWASEPHVPDGSKMCDKSVLKEILIK